MKQQYLAATPPHQPTACVALSLQKHDGRAEKCICTSDHATQAVPNSLGRGAERAAAHLTMTMSVRLPARDDKRASVNSAGLLYSLVRIPAILLSHCPSGGGCAQKMRQVAPSTSAFDGLLEKVELKTSAGSRTGTQTLHQLAHVEPQALSCHVRRHGRNSCRHDKEESCTSRQSTARRAEGRTEWRGTDIPCTRHARQPRAAASGPLLVRKAARTGRSRPPQRRTRGSPRQA
jgi:hypothetical protein